MISLYTYWRSTAAYRVRIALNLKGLSYDSIPVDLVKDGGEQHQQTFKKVNPQGLVPALIDDGVVLNQSMAIMEYLEEVYPETSILPQEPHIRARCRGLAQMIVSDIHPLNNLRVLQYLKKSWSQEQVDDWYHNWIHKGFTAIEQMLMERDTRFMSADYPCIDDICLIGQLYNARRFKVPLETYPLILEIEQRCGEMAAFADAHPSQQAEAQ
ncbi:maleylacetoacetate isomerase [Marinicella sp. W31]|uniref:maleylacetoacetate isomerase n=1 Tax=Marinicella sp. W31 TaxID=3023713 RepID=UPI0037579BE3